MALQRPKHFFPKTPTSSSGDMLLAHMRPPHHRSPTSPVLHVNQPSWKPQSLSLTLTYC